MIIDLPSTTTAAVSKRLVGMRNEVGAMALGRVLTLVIIVDEAHAEAALAAANDASRQHPSRIVAVVLGNRRGMTRLDAQIRVGGDAGASEIVVLRLYGPLTEHARSVVTPLLLPDSPVVAWWPERAPKNASADPVGAIAQRRITDSAEDPRPGAALKRRAKTYAPGDTDLAWTRITLWRGLLAASLDLPPYEPADHATVTGGSDSPSTDLLAAWLSVTLDCPVTRARSRPGTGLVSVRLERSSGDVDLVRPDGRTATLSQPGQPARRISLARRGLADCLADELRRLDPDEVYRDALLRGVPRVNRRTTTQSSAISTGEAPSVDAVAGVAEELERRRPDISSDRLSRRESPERRADEDSVRRVAAERLESDRDRDAPEDVAGPADAVLSDTSRPEAEES